ncbi:hypothetical protein ACWFRJ_34390 [Streptomyces sp. NPDC055239]
MSCRTHLLGFRVFGVAIGTPRAADLFRVICPGPLLLPHPGSSALKPS